MTLITVTLLMMAPITITQLMMEPTVTTLIIITLNSDDVNEDGTEYCNNEDTGDEDNSKDDKWQQ